MTRNDPQPGGTRVLHYRLERKLGEDALGEVYLAVDELLEREVVIKLIRTEHAAAPEEVEGWRSYFRSQARRAARVNHPGLVTIHAYEDLIAMDAIVMEHVPGETVEELLDRGVRWWPATTVRLMIRIADAVQAAHAQGIVHGHLNLHNVKVSPEGRVKVMDLGIPKLVSGEELPLAAAAGQGSEARPRADVRQLGGMAYRMLAAGRRFNSDREPAPDESPTDASLDTWLLGPLDPVLERAIAERSGYANAGEFAAALSAVLDAAMQSAAMPYRRGAYGYTPADLAPGMRGGSARMGVEDEPETPAPGMPLRQKPVPPSPSRLVLPPDFDSSVPEELPIAPAAHPNLIKRARTLARTAERRFDLRGSRRAIAAGFILLLAAGGAAAWKIAGGSDATVPSDAAVRDSLEAILVAPIASPPVAEDSVEEAPAPVEPPAPTSSSTLAGTVSTNVRGAVVREVGSNADPIPLPAELSVPIGDSLVLEVARRGYVPARRVFRGTDLEVPLVPDSVSVTFRTNVTADVLISPPNGPLNPQRIGTTGSTLRVPTGSWRVVLRTPYHPDFVSNVAWTTPGMRHTVEKMDYSTRGALMVTVDGTWARVSVDGGTNVETPHRFDNLPIGPHVLRLTRDGYVSITDTVVVRPDTVVAQRYVLRRSQ